MPDQPKTPYDTIPIEVRRISQGWFGPPWWSYYCFDESGRLLEEMRKDPPVGEDCLFCGEPIEEGQSGKAMPYGTSEGVRIGHVHKECLLRDVIGAPEHLDGECVCRDPGRPKRTYRQEALAVWERLNEIRQAQEHPCPGTH